jgi:hypothetical protein
MTAPYATQPAPGSYVSSALRRSREGRRLWLCALLGCLAGCAADGGTKAGASRASGGSGFVAQAGTVAAASPTAGQAASASPQTPGLTTGSAGTASPATAGTSGTITTPPPPPAAGCADNALDQKGCFCGTVGATRACYSADAATRNVGACKDGVQTCLSMSGGEFATKWGPCTEEVVPTVCTAQLDARCVGKVGCADEQCADKLGCHKDAGMPDAGNPKCHTVMGFGFGVGLFPDGGMWCER